MIEITKVILAQIWKDFLLEYRARDVLIPVGAFSALIVIIFNFALDIRPAQLSIVAPAVIWVAFTFASILGLNHSFSKEKESHGLDGLMLAPVGREAIYIGKVISIFLFLTILEMAILPIFSILFNLDILMPKIWLIATITTFGFSSIGNIFSIMALNTRAREIILPVLFFPVTLPIIIAAIEFSKASYQGAPWSSALMWLQLGLVFDIIFVLLGATLAEHLLQD